jgi:crotonobetainyl-CoA:carnitine CoA-transferase CaiB-like acyl-CoA transferase
MDNGALTGLKVIEYGDFVSAPYCGKLLSDLGADVIKIEKPGKGDTARKYGPFPNDEPHPEKSGLFLYLNTNKRGVTLNLKTAAGRKVFKELAKWADVLIENNPISDLKKLGLDYETLHKVNPRLVVTSITYFGHTGPYAEFKGSDLINAHTSGEAYLNPAYEVYNPDLNPPLKLPGHSGDFQGGLIGAINTMSGVFSQKLNGTGEHIDLSQQEALAWMVCHEVGDYYDSGVTYQRDRKYRWEHSPKFACKDGFVMMNIPEQFWDTLIKMMGSPEWAKAEEFKNPVNRFASEHLSQPKINEWTKQHTVAEMEKLARAHHLPFSVIHAVKEVAADPMFEERKFFVDVEHKMAGRLRFPGAPCKFTNAPLKIRYAAPLLGEHNQEVYGGILGYSAGDIVRMKQMGTI